MEIPDEFITIEKDLYRIRSLDQFSVPLLESLNLKTILVFDSGVPSPLIRSFAESNAVKTVHLGTDPWRSQSEIGQQHDYWVVLSQAMKYVLDIRNYPLLVIGNKLITGIVRRIENFTLSAVLAEFNSQSALRSQASLNYEGSVFLELLQLKYGSVDEALKNTELDELEKPQIPVLTLELPESQYVPPWFTRFALPNQLLQIPQSQSPNITT